MDQKPTPPLGAGDSDQPTNSGNSEHSQPAVDQNTANRSRVRLPLDSMSQQSSVEPTVSAEFFRDAQRWIREMLPEVPEAENSASETQSRASGASDDKTHHEEFPFIENAPADDGIPDLLRDQWSETSPIFKAIVTRVKSQDSVPKDQSLQNIIFNSIFGGDTGLTDEEGRPLTNYQDVLKVRYAKANNLFGFCQRVFDEQTDYSYQCFDCFGEGEESRKIICENCFDKGNHKGHQTTRCNSGGVCDCGTFIHHESPLGNCSMHNGLLPQNEVLSPEDIQVLSSGIQSTCFAFFGLIEETCTVKQQLAVEALFVKEFILPLNKIITSYSSMIPIVASLVMRPLKDLSHEGALPVQFLHSHDTITHVFDEHLIPKDKRSDCACSILELCFRFTHKFSLGKQTQIRDLLLSLSAFRPFKEYLAVCWVRFYPRLVRSKIYYSPDENEVDDDDPSHSPLCELRNEILQDSKILEHLVKLVDPNVIFRHLKRLSQPKIDDPMEVLLPIGACWSVYSVNDMVIMSKSSKVPCLMRDTYPDFGNTMYSVLFSIFKKMEKQTLALTHRQKFMETDEMQISLMKYQYTCIDLVHEQFASMIGSLRRDLCVADIKTIVGLLNNNWNQENTPIVIKSIEGAGPRILTVVYTGMLFLQTLGQDDVRIKNLVRQELASLNTEIIGDANTIQVFWLRMLESVLSSISMVHFVKRLRCTPFHTTSEEVSERYDGLEFDLYDITSLQYAISIIEGPFLHLFALIYFDMMEKGNGEYPQHLPAYWANYGLRITFNKKMFMPLIQGDESKLANVITEFFNLLTAVFSEDLAVVAVLSEYSVVRNMAVKKGIKHQRNKYYEGSMRREFLNSMLAQNPIKCEEFTKFAMVGLNHDDLLKETLVEECCDVDFEDRVISLKPKILEQALKDLDINSLNFREAHKDLLNGWIGRVDKQYHDKLSIKSHVDCELVKMARSNLARATPQDVVGLIKTVVTFSNVWKKVQGPLSSLLRFVLVYVDCLQESDPNPRVPLEILMDELIPYLDTEVKGSPVYKHFQTKLGRIRKKFTQEQPGVARTISTGMMMEDINAEFVEENTQEKVSQLFTKLKDKLFAKLKAKQAQFFSGLDETTSKYVQEFKTTLSSDALTCSVTKEQLTNSETYFMFAHMTESNLLRQATINYLKSLRQQMYLDTETAEGLRQHQFNLASVNPYTVEDVLIQSCGHLLKSENEAMIGDPSAGYLDNEYSCPMCKNSCNCVIPVYSQEIVSILTDDSRLFVSQVPEEHSLTYCAKLSAADETTWVLADNQGSKLQDTVQNITASLRRRLLVNLSAREEFLDKLSINVTDYQTRETEQFSTKAPEVAILSSMLRYSEITGFSSAIQSSPKLMNSIYLSFRIMILTQQEPRKPLWERFRSILNSLASPESQPDLRTLQSELLTLASILPVALQSRNQLFKQAIEFGLDSIISLFFTKQAIEESKLTWELIRYDAKYAHIINPVLRFLRMATFMKYAYSFHSQSANKKLMERIIQYNLQGDEKELEYHMTYLDISPPDLSKSHVSLLVILQATKPEEKMDESKPRQESTVLAKTGQAFKLLNQQTLNFSFFNCGRTLRQALEIFFHNCCQRCKRRTEKASICLLCGDLICAMECGFKGNDTDFAETHKQGQLTQHSMIVHKGKSVFLNCESLYFLFYDDTRKIIFDCMYLNKFGRIAETDKMKEFPKKPESYLLNSKKFQEIFDLILTQRGLEYIMRKSFTEDLDPRGNEL